MLTLLSRILAPIQGYLIAALMVMVGIGGLTLWYQSTTIEHLEQQSGALVQALTQTAQSLYDIKTEAVANQQAQATLRQQLASVSNASRNRQQQIEELKDELGEVKRWADAPLPEPVARLHQRPALSGGAEYRDWLSTRDPLSATGEPAKEKPRPQQ
jgi:LysB family phage lysis regulatory protein